MEIRVEREGVDDEIVQLDHAPCSVGALRDAISAQLGLAMEEWEVVREGVVLTRDAGDIESGGGMSVCVEIRPSTAAVARAKLRAGGLSVIDEDVLQDAIDADDKQRVTWILQSNCIPATVVGKVLCDAAAAGSMSLVDLIMSSGNVSINVKNAKHATPLLAAAARGQEDTCLHILEQYAPDVNVKASKNKRTPLLLAVEKGMLGLCKALIDMRADLNAATSYGDTALSTALDLRQWRMADMLLSHVEGGDGARLNVNTANRLGDTPLTIAAESELTDQCLFLIAHGADVHHVRKDGNTPLTRAAANRLEAVCCALIERGADVNAACEEGGNTPLVVAAEAGMEGVCKLLIEKGADIHYTRKDGNTPLTRAIANGLVATSSLLIARGADVNATTVRGRHSTPLTLAAEYGLPSLVLELLRAGADPNALRTDGKSALFLACECLNAPSSMIRSLLEHGADVAIEVGGETPFTLAADNHLDDVCLALIEHGEVVLGANAVDEGLTPLTLTARQGLEKASLALIAAAAHLADNERSAVLDARIGTGDTPLTLAAAHVNVECVCLALVAAGVRLDTKRCDGATAMSLALHNSLDALVDALAAREAAA